MRPFYLWRQIAWAGDIVEFEMKLQSMLRGVGTELLNPEIAILKNFTFCVYNIHMIAV